MIGIYKITNLINGKVYIGQSINIEIRWQQHKRAIDYNKTNLLYKAMRKHGVENFKFEIIDECNECELNNLEIYYIWYYNSYVGNDNSNGYNMTIGGETTNGYKRPVEDVEKMRRKREGSGNNNARIVVCDGVECGCAKEFAEKMGIKRTTVTNWLNKRSSMPIEWYVLGLHYKDEDMSSYKYYIQEERVKNKVKNLDKNRQLKHVICDGEEYESLNDFCSKYSLPISSFSQILNGKVKMPVEWFILGLRYKENDMSLYVRDDGKNKVVCDSICYDSITDCANEHGVNKSTMLAWFRGENNMPEKFIKLGLRKIK